LPLCFSAFVNSQALNGEHLREQLPSMLLCFQEGKPNEDDPALHDFVLGVHSLQAQWLLDQYGDVLYLDATHSANKSQCPNFAILLVDSLNHGHLVAIFILLHENAADMQIALESL
jgi:hypothetical protein